MNKTTKTIFSGAFALLVGLAANMALAAEGDNFVDEASAKGIAEIETAKMALEKGTSEDVKQFAQKMIDDHTKANQQLLHSWRSRKISKCRTRPRSWTRPRP